MLLVRNRKNIRITWCDGRFRFRYVDASVRGFRMKESFLRIQLGARALYGEWSSAYTAPRGDVP